MPRKATCSFQGNPKSQFLHPTLQIHATLHIKISSIAYFIHLPFFCYAISPSLKISVRSFLALPSRELKITPCPSPFLALKTFVSCPSSVRFLGKKRLFHREEMQTRGMGRLKSMPSPSAIRRHQTRNRRLSACVFLLVKLHNGIKKARVGETRAFFM